MFRTIKFVAAFVMRYSRSQSHFVRIFWTRMLWTLIALSVLEVVLTMTVKRAFFENSYPTKVVRIMTSPQFFVEMSDWFKGVK